MVLGMDFFHDYNVTIECNPFNIKMSRNLANKAKIKSFSSQTEHKANLSELIDTTDPYSSAWGSLITFPNPATKPNKSSNCTSESFDSSTSPFPCTTIKSSLNKSVRVKHSTTIPPMSYSRLFISSMGVNGDVQLTPRSEIQNSMNLLIGHCIFTLVDNESSVLMPQHDQSL